MFYIKDNMGRASDVPRSLPPRDRYAGVADDDAVQLPDKLVANKTVRSRLEKQQPLEKRVMLGYKSNKPMGDISASIAAHRNNAAKTSVTTFEYQNHPTAIASMQREYDRKKDLVNASRGMKK